MNTESGKIRDEVSRVYGERVAKIPSQGCDCGGAAGRLRVFAENTFNALVGKGADTEKSRVPGPELAGYSREDLSAVPEDAANCSFGCGNPTAFSMLSEGDRVLDLGCGAGIDLILAARLVGPAGWVTGVDMNPEMIGRARENIQRSGLENIEVRQGIIEELPVPDASFDWVISNCVINLSPEKARVFREIARVLKPGGRMLISDIVTEGLPREVLDEPVFYGYCVSGAIGEEEYLAGLGAAGLVETGVRSRKVYTAEEIGLFAGQLIDGLPSRERGDGERLRKLALEVEGRVASLAFFARKPD